MPTERFLGVSTFNTIILQCDTEHRIIERIDYGTQEITDYAVQKVMDALTNHPSDHKMILTIYKRPDSHRTYEELIP